MSDNVFDDSKETTPQATSEEPTPRIELPDEVANLVGEGKKYASVEAALKALPHAQQHITTLETELRELREAMEKSNASEEVYETVKNLLANKERPSEESGDVKGIDMETFEALFDRKLQETKAKEQQTANLSTVNDALKSKYGEKAQEAIANKAKELGVGEDFFKQIASTSPKAALELFGINRQTGTASGSRPGSVNTEALSNNTTPQKPKSVMGGGKSSDLLAAWRAAAKSN